MDEGKKGVREFLGTIMTKGFFAKGVTLLLCLCCVALVCFHNAVSCILTITMAKWIRVNPPHCDKATRQPLRHGYMLAFIPCYVGVSSWLRGWIDNLFFNIYVSLRVNSVSNQCQTSEANSIAHKLGSNDTEYKLPPRLATYTMVFALSNFKPIGSWKWRIAGPKCWAYSTRVPEICHIVPHHDP